MPQEFTPEINEDLYNSLSAKIKSRGVTRAGQARSEALSRGLGGDPYEASAVGLANQGTDSELNSLDSNLAYKVAGLNREERLGEKTRGWNVEDREDNQTFDAEQGEIDRAFREKMGRLGYDQRRDMEALQNRRGYQGALWNAGASIVGKVAGGLF